jgi:hypothetical protein
MNMPVVTSDQLIETFVEDQTMGCDRCIECCNKVLNKELDRLQKLWLFTLERDSMKEYKKKPLRAALEKRITRLNKIIKTL